MYKYICFEYRINMNWTYIDKKFHARLNLVYTKNFKNMYSQK